MKKEEIIEKLKRIIAKSGLEDLKLDDDSELEELFPSDDMRIGMFFFHNNQLYLGSVAGAPYYVSLGLIEQLNDILYRLVQSDGALNIIFDFGDYRLSCYHEEYKCEEIGIYDCKQEEWLIYSCPIEKTITIQETIDKIMNTNA